MNTTTSSRRRAAIVTTAAAVAIVTAGTGVALGAGAASAATPHHTASSTAVHTVHTGTPRASSTGTALAFTEPGTKSSPLALTATVGTPFSHAFHTTGGDGTVAYAIQDAPSSAYTVDVETGVLSGTPTTAGTFDLEVVALSGSTQVTEYVRLTVAPSPLRFTERGTRTAPFALTATAGQRFAHTFHTTGGSGSLAYAIQDSPSRRVTVDVETGTLSGVVRTAGTYDLAVVALRGTATATEHVRLTVRPAAPVGVVSTVTTGTPGATAWAVAADGVVTAYRGTGQAVGTVSTIPWTRHHSLFVTGLAVDRFGNRTVLGTASGEPPIRLTSSVATDRIAAGDGVQQRIVFEHSGAHRLTVRQDGVATSFTVTVG